MNNMKDHVKHFKPKEKLCMLIFDEVALLPHVSYNKHEDAFIGIDDGKICNQAVVFMVPGVTRKWKQLIAYSFCKGTTKSHDIKNLVVTLIKELEIAGNTTFLMHASCFARSTYSIFSSLLVIFIDNQALQTFKHSLFIFTIFKEHLALLKPFDVSIVEIT